MVAIEEQFCLDCKKTKSISDFAKDQTRKGSLDKYCKVCRSRRTRDYYKRNIEKVREKKRIYAQKSREENPEKNRYRSWKSTLKFAYGISVEDYNKMFSEQQGRCAICGRHQSELKKILGVDHNHTTKKVRGLLCENCNLGIGRLKDNISILIQAIKYLERTDGGEY